MLIPTESMLKLFEIQIQCLAQLYYLKQRNDLKHILFHTVSEYLKLNYMYKNKISFDVAYY